MKDVVTPTKPIQPSESTQPNEPTKPSQPNEPSQPQKPSGGEQTSGGEKPDGGKQNGGTSQNTSSKKTTIKAIEKIIKSKAVVKNESKLSAYSKMQLKLNGSKLSWKKVSSADGYIIYGGKTGTALKQLKKVSAKTTGWTNNSAKKNTAYTYVVVAYKGKNVLATSKTVHGVTASKKYTNPTKIAGLKNEYTMKVGTSRSLKASVVYNKKKALKKPVAVLRYESSNSKVVKVSNKGKLTAKKKGKATIYVYTINGICKKVNIIVK